MLSTRKRAATGSQLRAAEHSLASVSERHRKLEEAATQEKQQLRHDKHELERMLRQRDDELQTRTQLAAKELGAKLSTELKSAKGQLEKLRTELRRSEARTASLTSELSKFRADGAAQASAIEQLQAELARSALRTRELELSLTSARSDVLEKDAALQLAQSRLDAALEDVEWHKQQLVHQTNQLQLVEAKLSRSVAADDDEAQRRRQLDESNWHQRVAGLEHALAAEKQAVASLQEQHDRSVASEKERAEHAVAQCRAVTEELEVANLCLLERKRQREHDSQAFSDEKQALEFRITALMVEVGRLQQHDVLHRDATDTDPERQRLELEVERLREQLQCAREQVDATQRSAQHQIEDATARADRECLEIASTTRAAAEREIRELQTAANRAEVAELEVRHALESLADERDLLLQRVQALERAMPRSSAALSETRVELQRARQRIASLEEKLSLSEASRTKDVDSKLAQLSARERKATDEHKYGVLSTALSQSLVAEVAVLTPAHGCLASVLGRSRSSAMSSVARRRSSRAPSTQSAKRKRRSRRQERQYTTRSAWSDKSSLCSCSASDCSSSSCRSSRPRSRAPQPHMGDRTRVQACQGTTEARTAISMARHSPSSCTCSSTSTPTRGAACTRSGSTSSKRSTTPTGSSCTCGIAWKSSASWMHEEQPRAVVLLHLPLVLLLREAVLRPRSILLLHRSTVAAYRVVLLRLSAV